MTPVDVLLFPYVFFEMYEISQQEVSFFLRQDRFVTHLPRTSCSSHWEMGWLGLLTSKKGGSSSRQDGAKEASLKPTYPISGQTPQNMANASKTKSK